MFNYPEEFVQSVFGMYKLPYRTARGFDWIESSIKVLMESDYCTDANLLALMCHKTIYIPTLPLKETNTMCNKLFNHFVLKYDLYDVVEEEEIFYAQELIENFKQNTLNTEDMHLIEDISISFMLYEQQQFEHYLGLIREETRISLDQQLKVFERALNQTIFKHQIFKEKEEIAKQNIRLWCNLHKKE